MEKEEEGIAEAQEAPSKMLKILFDPLIWEIVSVVNIDDLISRNNPLGRKLKMTRGDFSMFCQVMASETFNQAYLTYLTSSEKPLRRMAGFNENSTVMIAKMLTLSLVYCFHYFNSSQVKLEEFSRIAFDFIMKLYQSGLLLKEDVIIFLEYAWVLSSYNNNDNSIEPLRYLTMFKAAMRSLSSFIKMKSALEAREIEQKCLLEIEEAQQRTNRAIDELKAKPALEEVTQSALDEQRAKFLKEKDEITRKANKSIDELNLSSNKEIDEIILALIGFLNEKLKSNYNLHNSIKEGDALLSLLPLVQYNLLQEATCKKILAFIAELHAFSYNDHFLNHFISSIKETLYDTYPREPTIQHLTSIRSQLSLVLEMFKQEASLKTKDLFWSDNGFLFNNHRSNGVSIQLLQGKGLNKNMSLVFSFKAFDLQPDKEYPLLSFDSIDLKSLYFRLTIQNDFIVLASKGSIRKPYKFLPKTTYLIILEWKKDSILSSKVSIDMTINGEKQVSNSRKEELDLKIDDKLLVSVGHNPLNADINFSGVINPVLIFRKNFESNVLALISELQGNYSKVLDICAGFDMKYYDKYSAPLVKGYANIDGAIQLLRENCALVISPLSVFPQRYKPMLKFPEIYYDFRKESKEDILYEFKLYPSIQNSCTYPVSYNLTSKEFLRKTGMSLLAFHLEFYYNLMLKAKDKEYLPSISEGVQSTLQIMNYYLSSTDILFDSLRQGLSTFLFSLGKLIYLICDYSLYLQQSITFEVLALFNHLLALGKKEAYLNHKHINDLCAKLFTFVLDVRFYDMTNNLILKKLFIALALYLDEFPSSEDLISTTSLDLLIKFHLLLSPDLLLEHWIVPNRIPIRQVAQSSYLEYKKMRAEYQLLLCSFIQKCHNSILFKFLRNIFESNYTIRIKYKLLKSYYLSRNKNFIETVDRKQNDMWQAYLDIFTTQNNLPPSSNEEDERYKELIKAILLQLLFENLGKRQSSDDALRSKETLNNTMGLISLAKSKMNASEDALLINLSYQSSHTIGEAKSTDTSIIILKNIVFNPPYSFNLVKSIFMLNYDFWDPKAKISFIAESNAPSKDNCLQLYNNYNLCLNTFNRSKKNHIAYFIQLLYKLDCAESRDTLDQAILLFLNYLFQVYRAFSQSQQYLQKNIECQYLHLFESKAVMCAFFTLAVDSQEAFKYVKAFLQEIAFNLVWKHLGSFIYKFAYTSIKKDAYAMAFLMKLIATSFNIHIGLIAKTEKIPEDKSMNIIEFLIVAYKLLCFNKIPKEVIKSDGLPEAMLALIRTFKERTAFLYSTVLFQVSKKAKVRRTLFELVIEFLFKMNEMTENPLEIDGINKVFTLNKNTICFLTDLRRRKKDKKDKYKEVIKETDVILCDNASKARFNVKESERKFAAVIMYIHTVRFLKAMKEKGVSVELESLVSMLQAEILEIYGLIGSTYYDKDYDSTYNKVIKQIMLLSVNKGTKLMYGSIDRVINDGEEAHEKTSDKGSSTNEGKKRRDSFSACVNKCKDITHPYEELNQIEKPQKKDKPIASIFQLDLENPILCLKRDLLLKQFGIQFKDIYFTSSNFAKVKHSFKLKYPPSDPSNLFYKQNDKQEMSYPSRIKNFSCAKGFYPKIILKQDLGFFQQSNEHLSILCSYIDNSFFGSKSFKLHHGLLNRSDYKLFSERANNFIQALAKYPCERITVEHIVFGQLFVYPHFIIYQSDPNFNYKEEYANNPFYTFSSYEFELVAKEKQIIIPIAMVQEVSSKRYLFRQQGIEIYLLNGKSYYFNLFNNNKQSDFITQVGNLNKGIALIINQKKEFFEVNDFTAMWEREEMTTFDYILQINKYSGRSYNDNNQYPIIPWFFSQLKPQLIRRNFQLPISVQTEEGKKKALNRYDSPAIENNKCHFNIHYSNVAFTNTFMVRMLPFTYNHIKFQQNRFDSPDRQFHSFDAMLSKLGGNDNRELIPEVLSMSEFALNLNYCNFGRRTDNQLINNLALPEVFSSPVSLMIFFKNSFNATPVKEKIHLWIDYTFGVNQEDSRKESCTLYPQETYESSILKDYELIQKNCEKNIKKMISEIKGRITAFITVGQTPFQLFDAPHPVFTIDRGANEKDFLDPVREIFYDNQLINKSLTNKRVAFLGKANSSNNLFCFTRKSPIKTIIVTEEDLNVKNKVVFDKITFLNKTKDNHLIYHPKYSIAEIANSDSFLTCRYYNNTIKLFVLSRKQKYVIMTDSFVSCLKMNTQTSVYSGHQNGKLIEWTICYFEGQVELLQESKSVIAHRDRVNAIEINQKLEIVITGGDDHMIYVRKMYDFELLSVIELKDAFIPVDIQISTMFDLVYVKLYNAMTQLFHLALYTLNGICYEELAPVKWFEFLISLKNKVLYLDTSNFLFQLSRDLKQKMKNAKLKGEATSFAFINKEKTIVYSYDNGNFEKIHFDLSTS